MALALAPTTDEIVCLYKAGELSAELARHHETVDDNDPIVQRCIALHNSGDIDLLSLPSQPAFAAIAGHAFFAAQHLYCEAIPKLHTDVMSLMECCRILVDQAGADLAATQPNEAFRAWCQNNLNEAEIVIQKAQAGDELAKRFVVFALQAKNNIESAIDLVQLYADDRRVSGMKALAGMIFTDAESAQKTIAVLEPFIADASDDQVRVSALLAAFDVLNKHNDAETARKLIEAAVREPAAETLYGLARIVWLHRALLDGDMLRTALHALEAVNPEHLGTVRVLDSALQHLLDTTNESLALDFLTVKLWDGKLTVENFAATAHHLTRRHGQPLYDLIVRWFLSGSTALCSNVNELVGHEKERTFDTTVHPLGLTPVQQIFLCRKAIGFLFVKPVACCSIIVSVLRACDKDVEGAVTELLIDPMLRNYGGDAKEYLKRIPDTDSVYGPIQNALAKDKEYHAGLDATGTIKELHPSDYQRDVVRQRTRDDMRALHKKAESRSVLMNLVHRSTILYGKRSLTYVKDLDGNQRAVGIDLKTFGTSFELPRSEILDPVGLDYMLRVYRVEQLR